MSVSAIFPGVPYVESPLFPQLLPELNLSPEATRVATDLHRQGFSIIDFPDSQVHSRIDRITANLSPRYDVDLDDAESDKTAGGVLRLQDAWQFDKDVQAIAANDQILALLSKIYGRRAFPFQTLNFPVGTRQHLHSDSIHFSSIPERFMCGVWLAMEDVHPDAGPLTYLPGSHRWPILNNAMIGRRGFGDKSPFAQAPFESAWRALIETSGIEQQQFLPKRGQALIWAANLLHGGSPQRDPTLTRWSQVTHYYFQDCAFYTPAFSDEVLGQLDLREIIDVATNEKRPNLYLGELVRPTERRPRALLGKLKHRLSRSGLPEDFDATIYYRLNPDVAAAGVEAAAHYVRHGRSEGRRYKNN